MQAAVDGPTNGQKSDGDAATWLPPNKAYRCTYVTRQFEVKLKYGPWTTPAEKDAIARELALHPLPRTRTSCAERSRRLVRELRRRRPAGAAPIMRGEPGYSSKLDRDGDGVACE